MRNSRDAPITPEVFIQFIKWLIILSLILPVHAQAKKTQPILAYNQVANLALSADNALQTKLWLPNPNPPKAPVPKTRPRAGYGGSCVAFAKKYIGVYGTWGNGGRKLTLNSGPVVGAVVIFQTIHVAVVVAINVDTLTIIESNFDWHGHIRTRILAKNSPSIRGFHQF